MINQFGLVSYTAWKNTWAEDILWPVALKSDTEGLMCGEAITEGVYTRLPQSVVPLFCQMMQEQLQDEYPDFVHEEDNLELYICSSAEV